MTFAQVIRARLFWLLLVAGMLVLPAVAQEAAADPNCPGAPAPRLLVGKAGRVLPGDSNNVREQAARGSTLVGALPGGAEFTVLDGPVCADSLNWWRVSTPEITGWTVEGSGSEYWVEPLLQATAPADSAAWSNPYYTPEHRIANPLVTGALARVQTMTGEPLALYASVTAAAPAGNLPVNTLVTLVEASAGGWWYVESEDGSAGWVREAVEHSGRMSPLRPTLAPICPYTDSRVLFLSFDAALGSDLYTVGRDGAHLCNLSYGLQQDFEVYDWSPDGRWIAFTAVLEGPAQCAYGCSGELYVMSVDGSVLHRLTVGLNAGHVQWSPDGDWLAVQVDGAAEDTREIRLIAPDGSSERTLIHTDAGFAHMRWSPDGSQLAVVESIETSGHFSHFIRLIEIASGDSQIIFESNWRTESLNWSPDSAYLLAATYLTGGQQALIEIDVRSGAYTELLSGEFRSAVYSPDGTQIAFWRADLGAPRWVEVMDRASGDVTRLAALPGVNGRGLSWVPEGDALLVGASGVMRVNIPDGALRSLFVGDFGSNWYAPLVQPGTE